ncbi:MAG TPA: hypothetical protein VFX76_16015, partial [Roseiflexaceae bacterium]|nr:hypothetical protein [Roseiflexaceae bacterium]
MTTLYQNAYFRADAPAAGSVYSLAGSTSVATYEVPKEWRGKTVNFESIGDDTYIAFGNAGISLATTKVALASSTKLAAHRGTGWRIPAGSVHSFFCHAEHTHFAIVSSGTTGYWYAFAPKSTETPLTYEDEVGKPFLWLDAEDYTKLTVNSGAITVANWRSREGNSWNFSEGSAYPDYTNAASSVPVSPTVLFTAGSSEKLISTDTGLCAYFADTSPFTMYMVCSRAATGAAHTWFSVGTTATDNGRFDFGVNASDDSAITRIDDAGGSDSATV